MWWELVAEVEVDEADVEGTEVDAEARPAATAAAAAARAAADDEELVLLEEDDLVPFES